MTARLAELLEALDALRGQVADLRWLLEEGPRDHGWLAARLREVERELDDLRVLLRAAERPAAPPLPESRPAERRRA